MKIFISSSVPLKKNYGLLGLLLIGCAALAQALLPVQWAMRCSLKHGLDLPCPTCGTTRCIQLILDRQWLEAGQMQPLIFGILILLCPLMIYSFFASLLQWPVLRVALPNQQERRIALLCAMGLIIGNWAYLMIHQ
jgi:hypothetical protein